jgi:hypothetical protein
MPRLALLAALLGVLAGCSGDDDRQRLPADTQARLPLTISLGNLCPGAESPPELIRDIRRRAEALLAELEARPDHLVTYTFFTEEEGPIEEEITVRELAEVALRDLRDGESFGPCAPDLQERLEAGLS